MCRKYKARLKKVTFMWPMWIFCGWKGLHKFFWWRSRNFFKTKFQTLFCTIRSQESREIWKNAWFCQQSVDCDMMWSVRLSCATTPTTPCFSRTLCSLNDDGMVSRNSVRKILVIFSADFKFLLSKLTTKNKDLLIMKWIDKIWRDLN